MKNPGTYRRAFSATALLLGLVCLSGFLFLRQASVPVRLPEVDLSACSEAVRSEITKGMANVSQDPQSADRWGKLGTLLLAQQFDEQAAQCLEQASSLSPGEFRWRYLQGLASQASNRRAAREAFEAALKIRPHDAWANERLGELLLETGEFDQAARCLENALRGVDHPARPLQALARVELALGHFDKAESLAGEALRISPNSRMTMEVLAAVLFRQGRAQEAQQLTQAMHAVRDEPLPWNDPYAAQALGEQVRDGLPQGQAGRGISSARRDALMLDAERLIQSNQASQAVSILQELQREFPDNPEVQFRLGVAFATQKQWSAARERFQSVVTLMPEHELALYNLAISCLELNDDPAALKAFDDVLKSAPENSRARLNKARLLHKQKESSRARKELEIILKAEPENSEAKALLGKLEAGL